MSKRGSKEDVLQWLEKAPCDIKIQYESDSIISVDFKVFYDWSWYKEDMRILINTSTHPKFKIVNGKRVRIDKRG